MSCSLKLLHRNRLELFRTTVRCFKGIKGPCYGKPPLEALTIEQILERRNAKDPKIYYKVDIGLPPTERVPKVELLSKVKEKQRENNNNKVIPTLDLIKEEWEKTEAPFHIKRAAEHYNIFQDLYGDAYFVPYTIMNIGYKLPDGDYMPVYRGNLVKPKEAINVPEVYFDPKPDTLYTLIMTSLDGHFKREDAEYVLWFVGNIPQGDVTKGDVVMKYIQPFPTRGTGYNRYSFVLYQQDKKIDYSNLKVEDSEPIDLKKRTFFTYEFYKARQDDITPAGLSFFQSDWDSSVTQFFHEKCDMMEPIYEYEAPSRKVNKQEWFPIRQPFNTYMEKYMDPKKIAKHLLLKRLKKHHPFVEPDPPLKYPHAHSLHDAKDQPTWVQTEIKKERLVWGKYDQHKDMLDPK